MPRELPIADAAPALPARERALTAEGWTRRFMAVGPRAEEAVALYRQLGFEVLLDLPTAEELREECGDCRLALDLFRVLYTRKST
jgi:hypothetical protein